jgi:DNA end-binding protein Ku
MAVTVWKGHLTFGLVSIPVRLFRAARKETVKFHQLYRAERPEASPEEPPDNLFQATAAPIPVSRIQQAAFNPQDETPAPIPRSSLVKGYEYEKDRYVVIEKQDIERIAPKTATEMQILEFVRMSEIDPIYLETSYYVSPEEAGEKHTRCCSMRCGNRDTSAWQSSPCGAGSTPW